MQVRTVMVGLALVMSFAASACAATEVRVSDFADEMSSITGAYVDEATALSTSYQRQVEIKVADIVANEGDAALGPVTELMRSETVGFLAVLGDALDRYVTAMEEVEVPDTLADPMDRYVTLITASAEHLPAMRDAVGEAATIDDLRAALAGSAYADGQAALTAACTALEQAVRDEGHGIDLRCTSADVGLVAP